MAFAGLKTDGGEIEVRGLREEADGQEIITRIESNGANLGALCGPTGLVQRVRDLALYAIGLKPTPRAEKPQIAKATTNAISSLFNATLKAKEALVLCGIGDASFGVAVPNTQYRPPHDEDEIVWATTWGNISVGPDPTTKGDIWCQGEDTWCIQISW